MPCYMTLFSTIWQYENKTNIIILTLYLLTIFFYPDIVFTIHKPIYIIYKTLTNTCNLLFEVKKKKNNKEIL